MFIYFHRFSRVSINFYRFLSIFKDLGCIQSHSVCRPGGALAMELDGSHAPIISIDGSRMPLKFDKTINPCIGPGGIDLVNVWTDFSHARA